MGIEKHSANGCCGGMWHFQPFSAEHLLMDEAYFSWNGILHTCSQHSWADEIQLSFEETQFQQHFIMNVQVGMIDDLLLSPCELPI
jgi:hypothetical protein